MEFWKTYVQGPLLINEVPIVKKLPLMSQKTISKKLVPSSSSYHQHRIREISPGMNSPMIIKELKPGSLVLVSSSKSGKNTPYLGKSISSTLSNEKFIEIPSIFYQTNNMPSSSGSVVSSSGVYTNSEPRMVGKTILTPMEKVVSSNGKIQFVRSKPALGSSNVVSQKNIKNLAVGNYGTSQHLKQQMSREEIQRTGNTKEGEILRDDFGKDRLRIKGIVYELDEMNKNDKETVALGNGIEPKYNVEKEVIENNEISGGGERKRVFNDLTIGDEENERDKYYGLLQGERIDVNEKKLDGRGVDVELIGSKSRAPMDITSNGGGNQNLALKAREKKGDCAPSRGSELIDRIKLR